MRLGLLVSTRSARYDLLLRLTMLRLSGRLDCALSSLALASATREGVSRGSFVTSGRISRMKQTTSLMVLLIQERIYLD
jgi:hypothetical protein